MIGRSPASKRTVALPAQRERPVACADGRGATRFSLPESPSSGICAEMIAMGAMALDHPLHKKPASLTTMDIPMFKRWAYHYQASLGGAEYSD